MSANVQNELRIRFILNQAVPETALRMQVRMSKVPVEVAGRPRPPHWGLHVRSAVWTAVVIVAVQLRLIGLSLTKFSLSVCKLSEYLEVQAVISVFAQVRVQLWKAERESA